MLREFSTNAKFMEERCCNLKMSLPYRPNLPYNLYVCSVLNEGRSVNSFKDTIAPTADCQHVVYRPDLGFHSSS